MEKPKTPAQLTALHLLNISRSVPLNPLNKVYIRNFNNYCDEKQINLPEGYIHQNSCDKCGSLYIPGITCSVRIVYAKSKSKSVKAKRMTTTPTTKPDPTPRSRSLQYNCLQCRHKKALSTDLLKPTPEKMRLRASEGDPSSPAIVEKTPPFEAKWPPKSTSDKGQKDQQNQQADSKSKKRSKKRKETHNLLNMISKKKEEKESSKMSLNLMDFMK